VLLSFHGRFSSLEALRDSLYGLGNVPRVVIAVLRVATHPLFIATCFILISLVTYGIESMLPEILASASTFHMRGPFSGHKGW